MKPLVLIIVLAFLALAASTGCIRRPSPNINYDASTITKATSEIDAGHYEEAVRILNDFLMTSPNDNRVRLLLSNAYVRWAGIKFDDFIPLARYYLNESSKKESFLSGSDSLLKALRKSHRGSRNEVSEALDEFESVLLTLEAYSTAFNLIPEIDEALYAHFSEGLNQAILADSQKKGEILYRVVLRIVDLKFRWTHQNAFNFMNAQCRVLPDRFIYFFSKTRTDYVTIGGELTAVYPNLGSAVSRSVENFDKVTAAAVDRLEKVFGSGNESNTVPPDLRSVWECI